MRGIIPNRPRQERIDNASWFSRRDLSDLQSVFSFFVQILHKKVQVWEDEYVLTLFFSSLFSLGRWSNWPAMHHPRQGRPSGGLATHSFLIHENQWFSCPWLLTNTESRFVSAAIDGVPGPLRLARHTFVVLEATHETRLRVLEGCRQIKKLFNGSRQRRISCWKVQKRIVFPRQGVTDLPSKQINDFCQSRHPII